MPDPISWSFAWPYLLAALAAGYLLGSIPFGYLLTRAAGLGDIRRIGSGNIGATNVLRTGDRKLAAATLLLDGLKGFVAAYFAGFFGPHLALAAGLGAVLGHLFPVWLRFKGGKGVATTIGVFFGLAWALGVVVCLAWIAVAWAFRISSLAALAAFAIAVAASWALAYTAPFGLVLSTPQIAQLATVATALIFVMHRENIARLLAGSEPRIGSGD